MQLIQDGNYFMIGQAVQIFIIKNILVNSVILFADINIDGLDECDRDINNRWNYETFYEVGGVVKTVKQINKFKDVCSDQPFLYQHIYFVDPYDIVCDYDESVQDVMDLFGDFIIEVTKNGYDGDYVYNIFYIIERIILSFKFPFNFMHSLITPNIFNVFWYNK